MLPSQARVLQGNAVKRTADERDDSKEAVDDDGAVVRRGRLQAGCAPSIPSVSSLAVPYLLPSTSAFASVVHAQLVEIPPFRLSKTRLNPWPWPCPVKPPPDSGTRWYVSFETYLDVHLAAHKPLIFWSHCLHDLQPQSIVQGHNL